MLHIKTIPVTVYQQNARVLYCGNTHQAVVVDPGGDIPLILNQWPTKATLQAVWITHSHIDHANGVSTLLQTLGRDAPVFAHADDAPNQQALLMQAQAMSLPYGGDFTITNCVTHGDTLRVGNHEFCVLHTPGHALGHVSLFMASHHNEYNAPVLIAGDALFRGSIGRTDLPGGNYNQLINSIQTHLLSLPNHTVVLSGHGPNTTILNEKQTNPFLLKGHSG